MFLSLFMHIAVQFEQGVTFSLILNRRSGWIPVVLCWRTISNHLHFFLYCYNEKNDWIPRQYVIQSFCYTLIIFLKYFNLGIWSLVLSPFLVDSCYNHWRWPMWVLTDLKITPFLMLRIGYKELVLKIKNIK